MTDKLTSRKFTLASLTLLVASLLVAFGGITPLIWRDVDIATVGAYITGNVWQAVKTQASVATEEKKSP